MLNPFARRPAAPPVPQPATVLEISSPMMPQRPLMELVTPEALALETPQAEAPTPLPEAAPPDEALAPAPETSSIAASPEPAAPLPLTPAQEDLKARVIDALGSIYDPEIPVSIWELGLVYRVDVSLDGDVDIDMTLTAPACPVAGEMPGEVQYRVELVDGVRAANVNLIWEPPWDRSRMSEEAQLALGMF